MNKETAIRIAALHDGEVTGPEKEQLLRSIEQDPEARNYLEQLRLISTNLKGAHVSQVENSASWSDLKQHLYPEQRKPQEKVIRFPRYATAAAAVLAVGMGIWWPMRKLGHESDLLEFDRSVYMVETELENATSIVYIDEPSGWTVVWVVEQDSLPEKG